MTFWLAGANGVGGHDRNTSFLYLRDSSTHEVLQSAPPPGNQVAQSYSWDLSDVAGRSVYLEISDGDASPSWAWMALGRMDPEVVQMPQLDSGVAPCFVQNCFSTDPMPADWTPLPFPPSQLSVDGIPFLTGTFWPGTAAEGSTQHVDCNGVEAGSLFLLGAVNTLDQGEPGWGTGDSSIGFFVGDEIGTLTITYGDGTTDAVPLILGYDVWWQAALASGPEPFTSDPTAQGLLDAALVVANGAPVYLSRVPPGKNSSGNNPYFVKIALRDQPVTGIDFADNAAKSGHLRVDGLTFGDVSQLPNSGYKAQTGGQIPAPLADWLSRHTLSSANPYPVARRRAVAALSTALATFPSDVTSPNVAAVPGTVKPGNFPGPKLSFDGSATAAIATNVYYENATVAAGRIDTDTGMLHESGQDDQSYGGFGGWIPNAGYFYPDSYSRTRSLHALSALSFNDLVEAAIGFFDTWQMYFPNNYPQLQLGGKPVPAHATVIANMPLVYFDQLRLVGWPTKYTTHDFGNGENDGNGMLMQARYRHWTKTGRSADWVDAHWDALDAIGEYIPWCVDNPDLSFSEQGLLYSESEGGLANISMFCNLPNYYGLLAYADMADAIGRSDRSARWRDYADRLLTAMTTYFPYNDPTYGAVWDATKSATWLNGHATLCPMLFGSDHYGYDMLPHLPAGWEEITRNTYRRQLTHNQPQWVAPMGIGYGQCYITQASLFLDQISDASQMVDWLMRLCFAPRLDHPYRSPEGATVATDGSQWRRWGDLGNLYQLSEVNYTLQAIAGIDDMTPDELRIIPRLPADWTTVTIDNWPVRTRSQSQSRTVALSLNYRLTPDRASAHIELATDAPVDTTRIRLGPFPAAGRTVEGMITGPNRPTPQHFRLPTAASGDSTWAWLEVADCKGNCRIEATVS